ncbi:hypothetical protein BG015_007263 [Linnemannia schmuckeri]|uniref:General transcription factor TFIIB n=1 Tax=Linnemannia schmuckeri TaxID=64567 RepID=A0A9P5RYR9_9FUNG|nr:hypothetical protein BG015_007263 [Linnemannia schmuckeri]
MSTPINTGTTTQLQPATHSSNPYARRSRCQCTGCGGYRLVNDHETASLVCIDCGTVANENMLDDNPKWYQGYGLTRVSAIGRELPSKNKKARDKRIRTLHGEGGSKPLQSTPTGTTNVTVCTRRYMQQVEEARIVITSAGRANGLSDVDVRRAIFFFLLVKQKMKVIGHGKPLACLYIAAREAGKKLRLIELAMQSGLSPFDLGADYKRVRAFLVQRETIDTGTGLYVVEEDPWTELERILSIGSSESIERDDFVHLPKDVKEALGINMESVERSRRLRGLLSMSQKFMIIAADASLDTSRRIQPLVAACLIAALEVRLQLTESPKEVLQWVGFMYNSIPSTVMSRYRELRKCILQWARRLPYVGKTARITEKKLVYFTEDVIKHFGHLQDKNRQLWALLDKTADEGEHEGERDVDFVREYGEDDGESVEVVDDDGDKEQDVQETGDDDFNQEQDERSESVGHFFVREYIDDAPLTSKDILASMADRSHDPPAYVAKVKRRYRLSELIQAAKQSVADPTTQGLHLSRKDSQRFEWIKQLLVLGTTTEDEILDASDNCLADWVATNQARQAKPKIVRSREELDSTELTERDLDDKELSNYLRSKPDQESLRRVMSKAYQEAEQISKLTEVRRKATEASKKVRERQKRDREGQASDNGGPTEGVVRERSWKLRLEALSDSDNELDTAKKALPRPGQRVVHHIQRPSTENKDVEEEQEEEEGLFDDVVGGGDAFDGDIGYSGDEYGDAYGYDDYD